MSNLKTIYEFKNGIGQQNGRSDPQEKRRALQEARRPKIDWPMAQRLRMVACAAARRATGTRNGEQLT